jgi:hypothetical protein
MPASSHRAGGFQRHGQATAACRILTVAKTKLHSANLRRIFDLKEERKRKHNARMLEGGAGAREGRATRERGCKW